MKKLKIRNIIKDKKARAVPIIAIIVVIILIIAGIAIYFFYDIFSDSDDYWETPTEFGVLGQEILLQYEDNSFRSVKSIADDDILSVYYAGEKIIGYSYSIKGKASGVGWDWVEVDTTDYTITLSSIQDSSGKVYNIHMHTFGVITDFVVDDQWHTICGYSDTIKRVFPDSMPPGLYTMTFVPSGSIRYRGSPSGDWETGTLPDSISLGIEVQSDQGGLSVTFTGQAGTI